MRTQKGAGGGITCERAGIISGRRENKGQKYGGEREGCGTEIVKGVTDRRGIGADMDGKESAKADHPIQYSTSC